MTPDQLYERGYNAYYLGEPYPTDGDGKEGYRDAFDNAHPMNDSDEAFSTFLSNERPSAEEIEADYEEIDARREAKIAALVISALTIGVLIGRVATVAGGVR